MQLPQLTFLNQPGKKNSTAIVGCIEPLKNLTFGWIPGTLLKKQKSSRPVIKYIGDAEVLFTKQRKVLTVKQHFTFQNVSEREMDRLQTRRVG